jgi:hypothetical protein
MYGCSKRPDRLRTQALEPASWLPAALLAAVVAVGSFVPEAQAKDEEETPFKLAEIYFETNGSACDMGIQIVFDTEGIKSGKFKDPNGRVVHEIRTRGGLEDIGGQTEGFLEGVEPVIMELADANVDCERDDEEISLEELFEMFPAGFYEFEGRTVDGEIFDDESELTYDVPDGPVLGLPDDPDGLILQDSTMPLDINWAPVTMTIPGLLPNDEQAPVMIVGYQVLVFDGNAGESPQEFNVVVPGDPDGGCTNPTDLCVTVPPQFLQPGTEYEIEVLAIEVSGNQTITEGSFSTLP